VSRAALIGAPLPMCSCGVVPVALGLFRAGAPRGSTTSFLIATPETGADSIALSYVLLGPFMMIARPVAAIASGIVTGLGVSLVPGRQPPTTGAERNSGENTGDRCCGPGESACRAGDGASNEAGERGDCCSGEAESRIAVATASCCGGEATDAACGNDESEAGSCCGESAGAQRVSTAGRADDCCADDTPDAGETALGRTWRGLRYAATEILDDISVYLVIGLLVAGVTMTFIPPTALAQWGSGLPAMLIMLMIGVPMYVCATESTPIAAAMLFAGVSPGTVMVFLLAGPATNIGTLAALRQELGTPWLIAYVAGVTVSALGAGLLTDALVNALDIDIAAQVGTASSVVPTALAAACTVLLTLLAIRPLRRQLPGFGPRPT